MELLHNIDEALKQVKLDRLGLGALLLGLLQLVDILYRVEQLLLGKVREFGSAELYDLPTPRLYDIQGVGLGLLADCGECFSVLFLYLVVDGGKARSGLLLATGSFSFAKHLRQLN